MDGAILDAASHLGAIDIFAPLSPDRRLEMARDSSEHLFGAGEAIVRQTESGSSMFVVLSGRANGVKGALLQQRVDGVWTKVGGPALKAKVKLLAPASFRIAADKLAGSVLKVPVSPRVTARAAALSVSGIVTPLDPGATVELQQDSERGWLTLVQTTTGVEGDYVLNAPEPGMYRVRVAPAQGFAEGLSGQIELG